MQYFQTLPLYIPSVVVSRSFRHFPINKKLVRFIRQVNEMIVQ